MIADSSDRNEVGGYVAAMRGQLQARQLDRHKVAAAAQGVSASLTTSRDAVQTVLASLPDDNTGKASSGGENVGAPFFSRAPTVSILQTSIEDEARKSGVVGTPETRGPFGHIVGVVEKIVHDIEVALHPNKFSTHDPDWVTKIAEATLDRIAQGNHPFNPSPAEYEITAPKLRIVVVGDWGSGLPRARQVSKFMAQEIADAESKSLPVHVVHLGDVYYSGDPVEVERRVLADGMWPVTVDQANRGVTSWALNGNHDMYGGGWGFFKTLLGDPRFSKQRSPEGKGTSFFRIKTPAWDLIGLDTSWDTDVLSVGNSAVLADPQASVVEGWASEARREGRKVMLLSHHQLVSSYDLGDIGTVLPQKLAPLLGGKQIAAWLWGHEHRVMGFGEVQGIPFVRCIGHGGIPVLAEPAGAAIPAPGAWVGSGSFEENGSSWHKFGFAVLDFDGPQVNIRYLDDEGTETRTEEIAV
ncbi:MAG: metallophosphoesterase [Actinomycetota bacterium]|nr:metallophosphoesterase [Actinomycetota bacterium]